MHHRAVATPASTRSTVRSSSIRRSPAGTPARTTRTAARSPILTATAASRGSTGCSRGTRWATWSRCRRTASRSPTATSRTRTTSTRRSGRATRTRALRKGPESAIAPSLAEARVQLQSLCGRTHVLATAASIVHAGREIWHMASAPEMTMRPFSQAFLDHYIAAEGDALLDAVGAYRLEGMAFSCSSG